MNPDYHLPAQKFQFKTKPQTNQKWERKERDPQFMKPVESGKINVKCVNSIFVNFTSHDIWLTPMKVLWKIKPPDFTHTHTHTHTHTPTGICKMFTYIFNINTCKMYTYICLCIHELPKESNKHAYKPVT